MFSGILIALAWLVILSLPAIIAYHLPVVPHHSYLDNYMNASRNIPPATPVVNSCNSYTDL